MSAHREGVAIDNRRRASSRPLGERAATACWRACRRAVGRPAASGPGRRELCRQEPGRRAGQAHRGYQWRPAGRSGPFSVLRGAMAALDAEHQFGGLVDDDVELAAVKTPGGRLSPAWPSAPPAHPGAPSPAAGSPQSMSGLAAAIPATFARRPVSRLSPRARPAVLSSFLPAHRYWPPSPPVQRGRVDDRRQGRLEDALSHRGRTLRRT